MYRVILIERRRPVTDLIALICPAGTDQGEHSIAADQPLAHVIDQPGATRCTPGIDADDFASGSSAITCESAQQVRIPAVLRSMTNDVFWHSPQSPNDGTLARDRRSCNDLLRRPAPAPLLRRAHDLGGPTVLPTHRARGARSPNLHSQKQGCGVPVTREPARAGGGKAGQSVIQRSGGADL